jgi:cysteine desulfurase
MDPKGGCIGRQGQGSLYAFVHGDTRRAKAAAPITPRPSSAWGGCLHRTARSEQEQMKLWKLREMLRVGILERISNVCQRNQNTACPAPWMSPSPCEGSHPALSRYGRNHGFHRSACASGRLNPLCNSAPVDIELAHAPSGSFRSLQHRAGRCLCPGEAAADYQAIREMSTR